MDVVALQAAKADAAKRYEQIGRPRRAGAFTALMAAMDLGQSCALQVLGDSTGVTNTRWPYLIGQKFAAAYPAYTVQEANWDDTSQSYNATSVVQTGAAGARYVNMAGGNGMLYPGPPGGAAFTTGIDIRIKASLPTIPTTSDPFLLTRGAAGAQSVRLGVLRNTGRPYYIYSADGTNLSSNIPATANPAWSSTPIWIRVTHLLNDGSGNNVVTFYTSTNYDPTTPSLGTWTQLGAAVTTAGVITSINNPASSVYFSLGGTWPDKLYGAEFRTSIGGTNVLGIVPDLWTHFDNTATFGGAPVLTIINGSKAGANITYLNDPTRLPKMLLPGFGVRGIILSEHHNDSTRWGNEYLPDWDTWLTRIRAVDPYAPIAVTRQNPRDPAVVTQTDSHARRGLDVMRWAAVNNASLIDVWRAFVEDGRPLANTLLLSDGIHPSDALGSPLWANVVWSALQGRS
jgi:hypothetical protein